MNRLEVLEGPSGRRIRSETERARIVAESLLPGAQVSEVARKHGATRRQIYDWRRRRAEQRHRGVADMFVDRPAEPVDRGVDESEEALKQRADVFRVKHGGEVRVADQIAEQHRDRTTVTLRVGGWLGFTGLRRLFRERPPATAAEPFVRLVRKTAVSAENRQCGAAGRAEFASSSVGELAGRTKHGIVPRVADDDPVR